MNKTKLYLTLFKNDNGDITSECYTPYHYTAQVIDTDGNIKTHKQKCCDIAKNKVTHTPIYTDYCTAVIMQYAPQLVYTCLKTVYTKSPNKKIRLLMNECIGYSKSSHPTKIQYEFYLIDKYNQTAMEQKKEHKYRMIEGADGKKHKVECIPYYTDELTELGIDYMDNINIPNDLSVDDLISECYRCLLELVGVGLINNVNDFWNYRAYAYKGICKLINNNKRDIARHTSLYTIDDDGEEHIRTIKSVDNAINKIDNRQVMQHIRQLLFDNLSNNKKLNVDNIMFTYDAYYIKGYSMDNIAKMLNLHKTQVARYKNKIDDTLKTPYIYDCLHSVLNA